MPDWEPAPPSARLLNIAADLMTAARRMPWTARILREIADDVAAMERRLAELTPKERADG